jgi:hypothetical protein
MIDFAWDKERERLPVDIYGYRMRVSATVEDQRREMDRIARLMHGQTRPTYYACGICGGYHFNGYNGDCRNDLYRIADPDELHGPDGWDEVPMEDAE